MHKVLLIDDDVVGVSVRAQLLEVNGYEVQTACTGAEGLRAFESVRFALVVLDLGLPDIDGSEVLFAMHASRPYVPIVVLSGLLEVPLEVEDYAAAVLVKGEGAQRLLNCIAEQLGGHDE